LSESFRNVLFVQATICMVQKLILKVQKLSARREEIAELAQHMEGERLMYLEEKL
jgi:hypothetical protein